MGLVHPRRPTGVVVTTHNSIKKNHGYNKKHWRSRDDHYLEPTTPCLVNDNKK